MMVDYREYPELFDNGLWASATEQRHKNIADAVVEATGLRYRHVTYERYAGAAFGISCLKHVETGIDFNLIPGGTFDMGLSLSEQNTLAEIDENDDVTLVDDFPDVMRPVHSVDIGPLLVSKVPLLQWMCDRYATLSDNPGRPDFDGAEDAPVYLDIDEVGSVLNSTGFRLLSESECEYVTRAGTETVFYFGDELPARDVLDEQVCLTRFSKLDANSLACNRFGLFGIATGTFCIDHWHDSYLGAPQDGRPWLEVRFEPVRVVRGGATSMWPFQDAGEWLTLVSAMRVRSDRMYESMCGVRLATSLP